VAQIVCGGTRIKHELKKKFIVKPFMNEKMKRSENSFLKFDIEEFGVANQIENISDEN